MMGVRRDYKRWDYDDETEITMEEQLTLEENPDSNSLGGGSSFNETFNSSAGFPPPNVVLSSSPIRSREVKRSRKATTREKAQLILISSAVILFGFLAGFFLGVKERNSKDSNNSNSSNTSGHYSNKHHLSEGGGGASNVADILGAIGNGGGGGTLPIHENTENFYRSLVGNIKGENIRHSMQRMSQEEHEAGTPEGKSMAYAIRDLWRGFGVSVRIEQHKTLITRTESFNFVELLDPNGTVLFTTSKIGDDVNLPNSKPIVAFSPSGNCSGTFIYGNYGRLQDLQLLHRSAIPLNGSIALIRFGNLHPSIVVNNAIAFGLKGIIFYPDPEEFGPLFSTVAVRRASILNIGQIQEFQKQNGNWNQTIPCHTISLNDAKKLLGTLQGTTPAPRQWQGGLGIPYFLGGAKFRNGSKYGGGSTKAATTETPSGNVSNEPVRVRLKIFNEAKLSTVYNVIAAIPGTMESDRYVILGCSHDSWAYGGSDPGNSLAISTELLRVFSSAVASGWKPRRSILFISWDGNLHAGSGAAQWLQEHHFEIMSRAVGYIDLGRALQGNETLQVYSSPLLKEVVRKAIGRGGKHSHSNSNSRTGSGGGKTSSSSSSVIYPNVQFVSGMRSDEPSFAFLGNLGVPFIHLTVSNSPKGFDYPLLHTAFDTFDNFVKLVDPNFKGSESLARVVCQITLLLSDSSALPITLQDYIKELRKEFDHFMAEYQEDFHKANLSLAYFQAAMMRLEVIANSFKAEMHNHSRNGGGGNELLEGSHHKLRREMYHRMLNDKFMLFEKALLTPTSSKSSYRHQIIGYASWISSSTGSSIKKITLPNMRSRRENPSSSSSATGGSGKGESNSTSANKHGNLRLGNGLLLSAGDIPRVFPQLRVIFECGRNCERGLNQGNICSDFYSTFIDSSDLNHNCNYNSNNANYYNVCSVWKEVAGQKVGNLVRALDSASAIIQSPIVPLSHPVNE